MNTLVSNVPGPPFDLFMAGGRVLGIFPTSIITESMALNITLFTYGGRMDFGVSADPEAVSDPFLVADGIPAALRELLAAARMGEPTPVIDAFGEPSHSSAARPASTRRRSSVARRPHRPDCAFMSAPRTKATATGGEHADAVR